MEGWFENIQDLAVTGAILAAALAASLILHKAFFAAARMILRRTGSPFDDLIIRHERKPALLFFPLLGVFLAFPFLPLPENAAGAGRHAVALGLIGSTGWLAVRFIDVLVDYASSRFEVDAQDNLAARRMRTRFLLLRRIAAVVIAFVTLSVMVMTFPAIRRLGVTMFASAGVAGLIVGLAARPMLTNVIAGLQLAFTQPIRIDDVVVVEGEWGRVEEIGTTYVVIRIWDLRRLVLPLSHFIERPFQNWTRATANILGTVYFYADYTLPVEEVRRELHSILATSGLWDGKAWGLQVTDATEHTLQLRALMSAPNSPAAWDLRCHVREKLVELLTCRYPHCLPKARAEVQGFAPEPAPRKKEGRRAA
jgi:small-conductance mechanosensitive channel